MMTNLAKQLTQTEKGNSLFEQSIKQRQIQVLSSFRHDNTIKPVSFIQESQLTTAGAVNEQLSKTVSKHQSQLLEAATVLERENGKNIAVLFSGGPASGGHNVVAGIFDCLAADDTLYGVKAGPKGLIQGDLFKVTREQVDSIRNTGGFDFLGSDRTKIKTAAQFDAVLATVKQFELDAIIVIGGDDSNTNAALLAEFLIDDGCAVIGVPKTIDGDLQVADKLPISFGFDTATKIYAELVGNILQDTPSSRKYWHFVKLMGRSASHVTLEVALQTKSHVTFISEEVKNQNRSLGSLVDELLNSILVRAANDMHYGVVLIPEGLIEFVPELNALIDQLNELMSTTTDTTKLVAGLDAQNKSSL